MADRRKELAAATAPLSIGNELAPIEWFKLHPSPTSEDHKAMIGNSRMIQWQPVHGAANHQPNLRVRQEEVMVDEAPPFR
jgi:hypothetical protein